MELLAGAAAAMQAVQTSLTGLDRLFLEDARLEARGPAADAHSAVRQPCRFRAADYAAVDVVQRRFDNRLEAPL